MAGSVWNPETFIAIALLERASVWKVQGDSPIPPPPPPPPPPPGAFLYNGAAIYDGFQTYDGTFNV